jgi:hypothetical protein
MTKSAENLSYSIVSRTITHPERVVTCPENQGAAIVIFNRKKDILLLKEKFADDSFGRRSGQWNILTETREPGERIRTTVRRGLQEELHTHHSLFQVLNGSYRETNLNYQNHTSGYIYFYRCIALEYRGNHKINPNVLFSSHNGDIERYSWVSRDGLDAYDIEEPARLLLDTYLSDMSQYLKS